ncbi:glycoside hydrolase family 3 N-terminal domain-containing protein [Streptococcus sp. NLN64]|uniref:glycoside hydrolase family 3 protein n=2 Tax=unclassified Streptococcus TaxID=2608887 RepID=UPI0018C99804|nr:glycoside hydrolase family 3 N-terminal domain-containing protein [Streptococcus sp. NLN64]MBG9367205.1 beta-hexosaminidase [Streptococcus sp. NLN64]
MDVTKKEKKQPSQKEKTIQALLDDMTLEEKVGQLFWARLPYSNQIQDIKDYQLGGYILFGKDFEGQTIGRLRALTDQFQQTSKVPMLIGSDEEGGTVTRISSILSEPFLSPMELYHEGGMDAIVTDAKRKSRTLKEAGINAGLAPVADVATDPDAFIYNRTISQDAKTTADYVSEVVQTFKKEGLGSTLKHFPGYGNNGDSHTAIIRDNRSLKSLRKSDFLPFKAGIENGADSILVSHNILTQVDSVPSSISKKVTDILRKELNFKGVIMTDDLDMAGLADFVDQDEAAFQVIQAGNDLILGSSYSSQIQYLLDKIEEGELTEKRIDQSVKRILAWKYDLGLLNQWIKETEG